MTSGLGPSKPPGPMRPALLPLSSYLRSHFSVPSCPSLFISPPWVLFPPCLCLPFSVSLHHFSLCLSVSASPDLAASVSPSPLALLCWTLPRPPCPRFPPPNLFPTLPSLPLPLCWSCRAHGTLAVPDLHPSAPPCSCRGTRPPLPGPPALPHLRLPPPWHWLSGVGLRPAGLGFKQHKHSMTASRRGWPGRHTKC